MYAMKSIGSIFGFDLISNDGSFPWFDLKVNIPTEFFDSNIDVTFWVTFENIAFW